MSVAPLTKVEFNQRLEKAFKKSDILDVEKDGKEVILSLKKIPEVVGHGYCNPHPPKECKTALKTLETALWETFVFLCDHETRLAKGPKERLKYLKNLLNIS
ncbi:MAG: hypothetical protein KJ771_00640 [Nanoarchaeota archaeon]|nr:hypothetical protein [Nanoarchaeota archaeon]